jgi:hypothetical protein
MKKMANFLILLGSGLAAFGISAFTGNFSSDWARPEMPNAWSGSLGWSLKNQIEIVVGVVSVAFGLILRRDFKVASNDAAVKVCSGEMCNKPGSTY